MLLKTLIFLSATSILGCGQADINLRNTDGSASVDGVKDILKDMALINQEISGLREINPNNEDLSSYDAELRKQRADLVLVLENFPEEEERKLMHESEDVLREAEISAIQTNDLQTPADKAVVEKENAEQANDAAQKPLFKNPMDVMKKAHQKQTKKEKQKKNQDLVREKLIREKWLDKTWKDQLAKQPKKAPAPKTKKKAAKDRDKEKTSSNRVDKAINKVTDKIDAALKRRDEKKFVNPIQSGKDRRDEYDKRKSKRRKAKRARRKCRRKKTGIHLKKCLKRVRKKY